MTLRSATENYLIDFHNRCPGVTAKAFARFPARSEQRQFTSSYACLADVIEERDHVQAILDMGCGDGYLLELIAGRRLKNMQLHGIDFSAAEIAIAKARLGDAGNLQIANAQSLPFEDGAIDYALSHMAIMLMDDVPSVLAESSRVLRSGGVFSAVIGRRFLLGPVLDVFLPLLVEEMSENHIDHLIFDGGILHRQDRLEQLFADDFSMLQVSEIDVPFNLAPDDLWEELCGTYSVDRLPENGKKRLKNVFLASTTSLMNADGLIETGWGLKKITAIKGCSYSECNDDHLHSRVVNASGTR